MDSVSVTNRRLRHIKNELKQLAELKNEEVKVDESIDDPICFPAEKPETIIKVRDMICFSLCFLLIATFRLKMMKLVFCLTSPQANRRSWMH